MQTKAASRYNLVLLYRVYIIKYIEKLYLIVKKYKNHVCY